MIHMYDKKNYLQKNKLTKKYWKKTYSYIVEDH